MAERLSEEDVEARLQDGPWHRDGDAIVRELTFGDFGEAIAFVNRAAEAAESANHHPDILVHGYKCVRLTLSTHSAGGITEADIELAGRLDDLA